MPTVVTNGIDYGAEWSIHQGQGFGPVSSIGHQGSGVPNQPKGKVILAPTISNNFMGIYINYFS